MSTEIIPDANVNTEVAQTEVSQPSDVISENEENATVEEVATVNYSDKSLVELTQILEKLLADPEKMKYNKEAEAIKSAFYKKLSKEKAEAGMETAEAEENSEEAVQETEVTEVKAETNPLVAIELGFKSLYNQYKKERAEYNRQIETEREENLVKKEAVIEDLKLLVEKQEDVNATFPEFREIQARWREIGRVPENKFRNINDTYQFYVEQFYDKVQINREMRDLDFKKNLTAKEGFCEAAEKLAENENIVEAFRELQKLHEQWKEYGPVAKEFREPIWERFKAATSIINKKYQAYFEDQKEKYAENLEAKTRLCEKVEDILTRDEIKTSNEWNSLSKTIEEIQKEWKGIGYASKKDNQKIYDRFRAACDRFYERKRAFYNEFKDSMNENMEKKLALIEQAEVLKTSTDWKKTTDQFINLQKQWKEIGAVPRKKSEQLWKRFRAACDEFFAEREKNAKPENDFYGNLKAKKALIEEIKAFELAGEAENQEAMRSFAERFQAIGFVPYKEKDNIAAAYKEAMKEKFPEYSSRPARGARNTSRNSAPRGPRTEKERLVMKYTKLQQDIDTYENNIGFFAASKNSAALIKQMTERIDAAKTELKALEEQIREIESNEE